MRFPRIILGLCAMFLLALFSCERDAEMPRQRIDLSGTWQFALDTADVGIEQKWYLSGMEERVELPGTTDTNSKGFVNRDTTTMHLNRVYTYEGIAWYRKKITVPESFQDRSMHLVFERSKSSMVWIDSALVGQSRILQSPQEFSVSEYLSPGDHHITVRIDNDLDLTPYGNVHIYSDDTQTNWNGILGEMYLESRPRTHISDLQVYPDVSNRKIEIEVEIENGLNLEEIEFELLIDKNIDGKITHLSKQRHSVASQPRIHLEYLFDESPELWDEYQQPLYELTVVISGENLKDATTVPFGMRDFSVEGTQFTINGRKTFLRGKHEAAVFPLTGYPPMEVEDWLRVYRIAKSYGINHYRFHSYCPPEAAFTAADREGIYLQAELPFWGGLETDSVAGMQRDEGLAMLRSYANHPSFVMFSPGNEIWAGHDKVSRYMKALKEYDARPLYTMGSNNNIGYMEPTEYSDFFVGARVPASGNTTKGHTRLTHAFADADQGGILNTQPPSTDFDFSYAVANMELPLVSHEIGQYQIYPDYSEIDKYTGTLRAWNLEVFRNRLVESGMGELDSLFQKASGAWSALCYKAEMEAALRTEGMAGFQLLDLQDFPGQGTALVGILDAFMDSKDVIGRKRWKQSCNDMVLLLEFEKYCWTNRETFHADVKAANYSRSGIYDPLQWELRRSDGTVLEKGTFTQKEVPQGTLTRVGSLEFELKKVRLAEQLQLVVVFGDSDISNRYPIWVYPDGLKLEIPGDVLVTDYLDNALLDQLQNGAKVLLFPREEDVQDTSLPGHFPPEFWNYGMFKGISEWAKKPISPGTLGILTDPDHPVFSSFPTDFHTNWQWFSIVKSSNPLILDGAEKDYLPLVQVIDNLERNHKLGLIFEFMVGNGRLIVCMSRLNELPDNPEALQLYASILNYMASDDFRPQYSIDAGRLCDLIYGRN